MEAVTGIGGVFFRARDPEAFTAWYREHLGIPALDDGVDPKGNRFELWEPPDSRASRSRG